MKLHSIDIEGFRAFSDRVSLELDADVLIVVGNNGTGKTSLFDAVLWNLVGEIPRFKGNLHDVTSRYAPTGNARVALRLQNAGGAVSEMIRTYDGEHMRRRFRNGSGSYEDEQADRALVEYLWPEARSESDPRNALVTALTRSVYLQQDLLREFIEDDDAHERFAAVSRLFGIGRLNELQARLERDRRAWSRASSEQDKQFKDVEARVAELRFEMERIGPADQLALREVEGRWSRWWAATSARLATQMGAKSPATDEAPSQIGAALKALQAERETMERRILAADRLSELSILYANAQTLGSPDVDALRLQVAELELKLADLREQLEKAQIAAAAERRSLVESREALEELGALAELALRHLGERCPVCEQHYDTEATRARLSTLCEMSAMDRPHSVGDSQRSVTEIADRVEGEENRLAEMRRSLQRAEDSSRQVAELEHLLREQMASLGLVRAPLHARSQEEVIHRELNERLQAVKQLYTDGEMLLLEITRLGEESRRAELQTRLFDAEQEKIQLKRSVDEYAKTYDCAGNIIDAIREVSLDVVREQINDLEPVLERIYARIDPHPTFRDISILSKTFRGKGQLSAVVTDIVSEHRNEDPLPIFSSSQLNAFAFSLFLAINLGTGSLPIDTMILDDPLQSLDDIHLLGIIDVLRRARERRQMILSTHDARLGLLLERKLRPLAEGQLTRVFSIEAWTRQGPSITVHDVPQSERMLKVVAA